MSRQSNCARRAECRVTLGCGHGRRPYRGDERGTGTSRQDYERHVQAPLVEPDRCCPGIASTLRRKLFRLGEGFDPVSLASLMRGTYSMHRGFFLSLLLSLSVVATAAPAGAQEASPVATPTSPTVGARGIG